MSEPVTQLGAESYRAHLEVIAYDVYLRLDQILSRKRTAALTLDDRATLFATLVAQQAQDAGCLPVTRDAP